MPCIRRGREVVTWHAKRAGDWEEMGGEQVSNRGIYLNGTDSTESSTGKNGYHHGSNSSRRGRKGQEISRGEKSSGRLGDGDSKRGAPR